MGSVTSENRHLYCLKCEKYSLIVYVYPDGALMLECEHEIKKSPREAD